VIYSTKEEEKKGESPPERNTNVSRVNVHLGACNALPSRGQIVNRHAVSLGVKVGTSLVGPTGHWIGGAVFHKAKTCVGG
jgi:hypothetical protein